MTEKADVVIIGGGIVGAAAAYYLTREGFEVIVVDRTGVGSQASFHASGWLGVPLHYLDPPEHASFLQQAIRCLKWMGPRVAEEAGIEINMREVPCLEVAMTPDTWDYMREWAAKAGPDTTVVSASETRRLEPRLGEEVYGGVVQLGTAQIDSYRMTLAFAQAAEQRGATVLNRNVTGLEREGSRVTGVQTDAGAIACDRVVLAMGAWSGEAERRLEFPVPVKPLKGQLIRMHYPGNEYWPYNVQGFDIRPEAEQLIGYVHMRRDGLLCCGSTSEPAAGFDTTPTEAARLQLLRFAARLMPCVVDSELVHQYGGPRPSPPDGTTVIGTVPGWEGVYLSVAAAGIQCCSLMGQIVCDLISDREPPVPIDTLVPEKLLKPLAEVYGWRKFLGEVFV